jgi:hypothetical protein
MGGTWKKKRKKKWGSERWVGFSVWEGSLTRARKQSERGGIIERWWRYLAEKLEKNTTTPAEVNEQGEKGVHAA